jgi:hypothetical protein
MKKTKICDKKLFGLHENLKNGSDECIGDHMDNESRSYMFPVTGRGGL